jgi:hypothetical protein
MPWRAGEPKRGAPSPLQLRRIQTPAQLMQLQARIRQAAAAGIRFTLAHAAPSPQGRQDDASGRRERSDPALGQQLHNNQA